MRPHRLLLAALAIVASVWLGSCGGKKRPPAVTRPGGPPATESGARGRGPGTQPLPAEPDIRPVEGGSARGEDFPVSDASGEGGPLEDIHFAFNQATLSDEARAVLEKHAVWLQTRRDAKVTIEGHCDERGTVEYNLALGDKRAAVTREYLAGLGVAPGRLKTVSYGKERPVDPGHDEAAWKKNRRAHFAVSR